MIQHLKCGLSSTAVLLTYTPGSNLGNSHWIWFTNEDSISSVLKSCQPIIEDIKKDLPVYHTRAMRKAVFEKFGQVTPNVKKSVLRHFYRDLTADQSGSSSLSEQEVDERLCALFELEEPDLIYDLRAQNSGRPSDRFQIFWQKAKDFLEEDVGTAVDDRRHLQVVHLAKAISVHDFRQQVKQRCPPEVSIPCDEFNLFQPTYLINLHQGTQLAFRLKEWFNTDSGECNMKTHTMQLVSLDICVNMQYASSGFQNS